MLLLDVWLLISDSDCILVSLISAIAVAPICYAHLAATQMGQMIKFEEKSETTSSHGGLSSAGTVPVPQVPKLQENVRNSMFFC